MTAEIAVMNKWAVALAADSKVTISGMRASKAYDTVNKLFTLSKVHPVGVMIYGNAEFMDYPWETIIKLYRNSKGRESEPTVSSWADDFVRFLKQFGKMEDHHKRRNISNICSVWLETVVDASAARAPARKVSVGSPEYIELLKSILDERIAAFDNEETWLSVRSGTAMIKKYAPEIAECIQAFLGNFQDEELRAKAAEFLVAALLSKSMSPQSSGIVFAGFGDNEYFPTVIDYETDGYVGNSIKIERKDVADVRRSVKSCIRAFAQSDMVSRFMNGVDADFFKTLMVTFIRAMTQNCFDVLDKYGRSGTKNEVVKNEIEEAVMKSVAAIGEGSEKYMRTQFSDPIIQMVALLPKDELAHLAESLVALTSLKRRVSSDAETVGGPIDVALISKGDGFVWIKRKHYFPADLNHQFSRNYMDTLANGASDEAKQGESLRRRRPAETGSGRSAASGGRERPRARAEG